MPTGAEFGAALSGLGSMSTGPSMSFMSKLGQMAPGILGGMSSRFGDPEIQNGSSALLSKQRPRNMGGMRPPVQGPQLVQPPTNIPNIAPGMTDMMGPRMPQSTQGPITMPGQMGTTGGGMNRFSMPSGNTGFTGGAGGGNLWDIYSQLLNQGGMMGMGMM